MIPQTVSEPNGKATAPQDLVFAGTPEPEPAGFPSVWLVPIPDAYVIDSAHWNDEPAPETDPPPRTEFSVDWDGFYGSNLLTRWIWGVEVWGLVIHRYFDLPGCIIPVAYIPRHPLETFVFTVAEPCDVEGKKVFYLFNWDSPLEMNHLYAFRSGFSSVADFHRNRRPDQLVRIMPREDREAETEEALVQCGYQRALRRADGARRESDE
ncbi:hypothetical protein MSAN_01575600 [Mycena sanguinolenta]|uniref:Uncharacterized protein n=1 Tax=Mycena sanguinolenta TaxID=230812 RepID=A0A8H6Y3D1_9AGAR|nr:hypothetical protein MSAN_01575600 [Mycena sanguinolenta]